MISNRNKTVFNIILTLSIAFSLLACDKDYDPVFNNSPDERLKESLAAYNTLLTSAPFGWKAMLHTNVGTKYFYYFDFNADGTVTMLSDFNETAAGDAMAGTWVLKALQRPTLSFTTYSYIHLPADPDGNVNGGGNGQGLISDFEFAFAGTSGDSVIFEGIQRGSTITFLKATEQEATIVRSGRMKRMLNHIIENKGLRLILPGDKTVTLAFSEISRVAGIEYITADGTGVEAFRSTFTFTTEGIVLKTPVTIDGYAIQEFLWHDEKKLYETMLANTLTEVINVGDLSIFKPSIPLYTIIGSTYTGIQIPTWSGTEPLPGQSPVFTSAYNQAAADMLAGQYKLTMREINFIFNPATNTMLVDVIVLRNTTFYLCEFNYSYTVNDDGIFTFSFNGANENGEAIAENMSGILSHFDTDTFSLEYVGGDFDLIGGFFSQETPDFYFSGYLKND